MASEAELMLERLRREQQTDARAMLDALRREQAPQEAEQPAPTSATGAVARGALQQFLDNILGIPDLAVTTGAQLLAAGAPRPGDVGPFGAAAALIRGVTSPPRPGDVGPFGVAQRLIRSATGGQIDPFASAEQFRRTAPQIGDRVLGLPRGEDFVSTDPTRPTATAIGSFLGDAATIATARAPLGLFGRQVPAVLNAETRAATVLGRALQTTARAVPRVGARAAETGAEVALLEALKSGDPAEVGLIAAGVQAGTDITARPLLAGLKKTGLTRAVLGATMASLIAQEVAPGGFQIVEQTLKDRGKEIGLAAILAGGAAALTSRGDLPRRLAGPAAAELANSLSSTGLQRIVSSLRRDPETVAPIAEQFATDPNFFGAEARAKLERAFAGDGPAPDRVIGDLLKSEDFRRRLAAINSGGVAAFRDAELRGAIDQDNDGTLPMQARPVAQAIARRLSDGDPLKSTLERSSARPAIGRLFADADTVERVLPRLSETVLTDALEANLSQVIASAGQADGGRLRIDGARLRRAWEALPDAARNAYPEAVQQNIEAFIARAETSNLTAMPPFAARALMQPDGALAGTLR